MQETTDTRKFENAPAGVYHFTVMGVPEKRRTSSGKNTFRIWKLSGANEEGQVFKNISILMFPWDSAEFLLNIGGTPDPENPKLIVWDDEKVDGKKITAELYYELDKDGKEMAKLKNINDIPF